MKKRDEIKDIKVFAAGIGVICQLIALFSWWKGGALYPYISAFGLVFGAAGLLRPGAIKPVYKRWMILALAFGRFQTRLLLCLLFYLVITPIGVVLRLMGKDLLDLKLEHGADSYWKKREPERDLSRYEKQF